MDFFSELSVFLSVVDLLRLIGAWGSALLGIYIAAKERKRINTDRIVKYVNECRDVLKDCNKIRAQMEKDETKEEFRIHLDQLYKVLSGFHYSPVKRQARQDVIDRDKQIFHLETMSSYLLLSMEMDEQDRSVLAVEELQESEMDAVKQSVLRELKDLLSGIETESRQLDNELYYI